MPEIRLVHWLRTKPAADFAGKPLTVKGLPHPLVFVLRRTNMLKSSSGRPYGTISSYAGAR